MGVTDTQGYPYWALPRVAREARVCQLEPTGTKSTLEKKRTGTAGKIMLKQWDKSTLAEERFPVRWNLIIFRPLLTSKSTFPTSKH